MSTGLIRFYSPGRMAYESSVAQEIKQKYQLATQWETYYAPATSNAYSVPASWGSSGVTTYMMESYFWYLHYPQILGQLTNWWDFVFRIYQLKNRERSLPLHFIGSIMSAWGWNKVVLLKAYTNIQPIDTHVSMITYDIWNGRQMKVYIRATSSQPGY